MNRKIVTRAARQIYYWPSISVSAEESKEPAFRSKMWERMWKMEGIFAEEKNFHGLHSAKYRGLSKAQSQIYVISTVQNLKRLAGALFFAFKTTFAELK